ncbi:BA75_03740T0 [Komagataella pastoris]|uniref:BA75_03740T0 n=1 Tax=Komagataella pastoris TaxID=4922 RepID=A0A1B2JET7_PICPA|nr:BA75_03740T0 [Komagataella pastoris]
MPIMHCCIKIEPAFGGDHTHIFFVSSRSLIPDRLILISELYISPLLPFSPPSLILISSTKLMANIHLILLVHGLWGKADHLSYIQSEIESDPTVSLHSKEKIVVYRTGSNEGYKTYDGIDLCGKRVGEEVEKEIARLNDGEDTVTHLSVMGYSLGGLIARYAIGVLYLKGYFKSIEPVNFTTFCSPHVGVLAPGDGVSVKIFNCLVPYLLANSGKQMFLMDKVRVIDYVNPGEEETPSSPLLKTNYNYQPLLLLMANPASVFHKALNGFKYKSLYANVTNDKRTSWWTAGISTMNPFEILDKNPNVQIDKNGAIKMDNGSKMSFHFIKDFEPNILDVKKTITVSKTTPKDTILEEQDVFESTEQIAENFFKRKAKWFFVFFNIVIYVPCWVITFIITNLIQRFQSTVRVIKASAAETDFWKDLYQLTNEDEQKPVIQRRPSLSRRLSESYDEFEKSVQDNIQTQTEDLIESVWDAMTSKRWDEPVLFEDGQPEESQDSLSITLEELSTLEFKDFSSSKDMNQDLEFFRPFQLKLSPPQKEIVHNLNKLNWNKFPVYITKTTSSHAAVIVRQDDPDFIEGKAIVQHWVRNVLRFPN